MGPLPALAAAAAPQGAPPPGPAAAPAPAHIPGPAPAAAGPDDIVAASVPRPGVVRYRRGDGSILEKSGGSRAWRNNNPGNIISGSFVDAHGAVGSDGVMAIFPDRQTGRAAIETLLRAKSYRDLTIREAIFRYAPPNENDSAGYVAFVVGETGLAEDTVLSTLLVADLRKIVRAIEVMEGWTVGTLTDERDAPAPAPGLVTAAAVAHEWMKIAEAEAALPVHQRSEWPDSAPAGERENPRILEYLNSCDHYAGNPADSDEISWCAGFVNFCLERAGFRGNEHPGARSVFWNRRNQFVPLPQPAFGAIAVLRDAPFGDPTWETGSGHVGFIVDADATGLTLLGGNQSNTVRRSFYALPQRDAQGAVTRRLEAIMMPRMN
ncbi:MAG: TIGR02594 family protein [Pseudomonadota bacterium]